MITYNGNQFDGVTSKPELTDDFIEHYGIKGMKWRHVKAKIKSAYAQLKGKKKQKQSYDERHARYVASHIAQDEADGRRANRSAANSTGRIQNVYEYDGKAHTSTYRNNYPKGGTRTHRDSYNSETGKSTYVNDESVSLKELNKARKSEERRKKKS